MLATRGLEALRTLVTSRLPNSRIIMQMLVLMGADPFGRCQLTGDGDGESCLSLLRLGTPTHPRREELTHFILYGKHRF